MLEIEQRYFIKASPEEVWAALTDPALQAKWTGQPAQYEARVGGAYQLFDDYVTGEIVEADAPNRLAQTWKPNDWTIENSVVAFTLRAVRGGTEVDLVHENVQPEDYEGTAEGWNQFYIGAIKSMLEGGKVRVKAARKARSVKKVAGKAVVKKRAVAKRATVKKKTAGAAKKKKTVVKKKEETAKR